MSAINLGLLDRAVDHVAAHPESWRQDAWRCETGMCVAGWICSLAGEQWANPPDHLVSEMIRLADGQLIHARDRAMELLGLQIDDEGEYDLAEELSDPDNTLADIRAAARGIRTYAEAAA